MVMPCIITRCVVYKLHDTDQACRSAVHSQVVPLQNACNPLFVSSAFTQISSAYTQTRCGTCQTDCPALQILFRQTIPRCLHVI